MSDQSNDMSAAESAAEAFARAKFAPPAPLQVIDGQDVAPAQGRAPQDSQPAGAQGMGPPPDPTQATLPAAELKDKPAAEQPPAAKPVDALDQLAAKDRALIEARGKARTLETRLRELERQQQEQQELWRSDPLAALHRQGLTQAQLNERFLGLPTPKQGEQPAQGAGLSPELAAKLDELEQWKAQQQQELQQYRERQAREQQVGTLREHIAQKLVDLELVNELGAYDAIYDQVLQHLQGGRFADEEEAATTIAVLAQQHENKLRNDLRAYLGKPKARAFLERELRGTPVTATSERERPAVAPPADPVRASTSARAQLSNDLQQQRLFRPPPDERFDRDVALRQAIEDARAGGISP